MERLLTVFVPLSLIESSRDCIYSVSKKKYNLHLTLAFLP